MNSMKDCFYLYKGDQMKKLFLLASLVFQMTAFASDEVKDYGANETIDAVHFFSISCTLPKDESVHRFQAIGYVGVAQDGTASGNISLQLIKGNEIRSVLQFNDMDATGIFERFDPTDSQPNGFHVLTLSVATPYIRNISLIFKDAPLASAVLSIDNFSYRSDCKFVK